MRLDSFSLENSSRLRPLAAAALVGMALAALGYWAGVPHSGLALFAIGIAVLIGWVLLFTVLGWRLLAAHRETSPSSIQAGLGVSARRWMATVLAVSTLSLTVGGFWDEVWHRKFGLPFGEDLLWRPHLLIYFGLLVPPALAAVSLIQVLRQRRGGLRDRLQADRFLTLLWLVGGFLLFTVPADPVWHLIYGEDISAWSLPHLVLMLSAVMVAVVGVLLHRSTVPARRNWSGLQLGSALTLLFLLGAMSITAQVLIGDFSAANPAAVARPIWLLPSLVTALAVLLGSLVNRATRSYGAATAVGLLTLATRFALVQAFAFPEISAGAWLPLLPPLVALDLAYAWRARRAGGVLSAPAAAAWVLPGSALALALIPRWYSYVQLRGVDIAVSLLAAFVASMAAAWLGGMIGDYLAATTGVSEPTEARSTGLQWAAPVMLAIWALVVVLMIATAAPPTHTF